MTEQTLSLSALREVADKATQDEWSATDGTIWVVGVEGGPECCGYPTPSGECCGSPVDGRYPVQERIAEANATDAAHIATFDPPTVKRLLASTAAARALVAAHEYKTPAGTTNCRYCDNNMDHEGTYADMHAEDCPVRAAKAALTGITP